MSNWACAGYDKYNGYRKLPLKTVVNSVIVLLAGSLSLDDDLHAEFAKAGYIAPKSQIRGNQKAVANLEQWHKERVEERHAKSRS